MEEEYNAIDAVSAITIRNNVVKKDVLFGLAGKGEFQIRSGDTMHFDLKGTAENSSVSVSLYAGRGEVIPLKYKANAKRATIHFNHVVSAAIGFE